MGRLGTIIITIVVVAIVAPAGALILAPRLDWSALGRQGPIEDKVSDIILGKWIENHAENRRNPIPENPENLKQGQQDYEEHCSTCHGFDGGGHNLMKADFYPPIPSLTGDTQDMSDGQIYFVVSKGIRYTARPGFEKSHSSGQIWRMILWVRHLPHLSPEEKSQIQAQEKGANEHHGEMPAMPDEHHN